MLTSIYIENFKGIAARQRIDFAPLTLLFGANSAGKSTILQALLYLYELIERGTADVDRTELGGNLLELGGFARLVHRHESERAIVLRAEFATPGGLERFGRDLTDFPFPDLDDEIESAWLELTIRFRSTPAHRGAVVDRAAVGVNGDNEPLVWLELGASLREGEPLHARVNMAHPLLATETRELPGTLTTDSAAPVTARHAPAEITAAWEEIALPEDVVRRGLEETGDGTGAMGAFADGSGFGDGRSLPVFALSRTQLSALPLTGDPLRVIPFGDDSPEKAAAAEQVRTFFEMIVLGTTAQLSSFLHDAIYIGPLRTIPPRGFLYERAGRITSWGDGLAAWDSLLSDRLNLIEDTNKELRRLGAGCQVAVQQLVDTTADAEQVTANHPDKTVRRLLLDTGTGTFVLPSEVGAGISQIIPVIVAAVDRRSGLTLIEQPELHVHPAVQVGLGDLFIDTIMREGSRRMMIVETHSEHLILRLLRRIRETTENELPDEAVPFTEDKLSVLYVESTPDGVRVRRLRVDERGEFVDRWPKGFFEERAEELF
jgi:hypothetical protein